MLAQRITPGYVSGLVAVEGSPAAQIAAAAPEVAERAGVHVDCAIRVLAVLDGWELLAEGEAAPR